MPRIMDRQSLIAYFMRINGHDCDEDMGRRQRLDKWEERHPLAVGDLVRIWWWPKDGELVKPEWIKGLVTQTGVGRITGSCQVDLLTGQREIFDRMSLQKLED